MCERNTYGAYYTTEKNVDKYSFKYFSDPKTHFFSPKNGICTPLIISEGGFSVVDKSRLCRQGACIELCD